eukprot:6492752-Amphidinium_carterae.2
MGTWEAVAYHSDTAVYWSMPYSQCWPSVVVAKKTVLKAKGKKGGAGGTWRLFLRLHYSKTKGIPSMRAASEHYKALRAQGGAEWEKLHEQSKAIRTAAKVHGTAHAHHLGLTAKQQLKIAHHNVRSKFCEQLKGLSMSAQADAIIGFSSADSSIDKLPGSLDKALKLAKFSIGKSQQAKADELNKSKGVLKEYDSTLGKEKLTSLLARAPWLKGLPLKSLPAGSLPTFFLESQAIDKACSAISRATEQRSSDVAARLSDAWEAHHVLNTDVEAQTTAKRSGSTNLCQEVGFCLCKGKGKLLRQCHARFLQLLKQAFHTKVKKETLAAGNVVVIFAKTENLSVTNLLQASGTNYGDTLHIFGIALMYFSPYKPTLELLKPCPNPEPCAFAFGQQPAYVEALGNIVAVSELHFHPLVKATCHFQSAVEALQRLDLMESWWVHLWALADRSVPVETVAPKCIAIQAGAADSGQLWPIPRRRKRCREPQLEVAWQLFASNAMALDDDETEEGDKEEISEELLQQWEAADEEGGEEQEDAHEEIDYLESMEEVQDTIASLGIGSGLAVEGSLPEAAASSSGMEVRPVSEAQTSLPASVPDGCPNPTQEESREVIAQAQPADAEAEHVTTHVFLGRTHAMASVTVPGKGK